MRYPPLGESDSRYSDSKKDCSSSAAKFWSKVAKISHLYIGEGEVYTHIWVSSLTTRMWQWWKYKWVAEPEQLSDKIHQMVPPARPRDIPILPPTGSVQCTRWSPVTYITSDPYSALPRLGHQDEVKSRGILILLPHLHKGGLPWQFYITSSCAPVLTFGVTKYVFLLFRTAQTNQFCLIKLRISVIKKSDMAGHGCMVSWCFNLCNSIEKVFKPGHFHFQVKTGPEKVSVLSCQGSRGSTRWSQQRRKWWRRRKRPQTFHTHRF